MSPHTTAPCQDKRSMQETTALLGQPQDTQRRQWRTISTLVTLAMAIIASALVIGTLVYATIQRQQDSSVDNSKRLSEDSVGRFLHITDMHIDMLYTEGSTTYSQCHRRPPRIATETEVEDGHRKTGRFGIAEAKCDSPLELINATSEHLRQKWGAKGQVDFVIWTGDSGRHDKDLEVPRSFSDIEQSNILAAAALRRAFSKDVPVVPNIGNNDVSPHNELPAPGHKRALKTFRRLADAWNGLIPKDQMATFLYGGYFARDVVDFPSTASSRGLTALSLNTMYWYRANDRVGGCKAKDSPGLAQLAWIRYQMRRARERNRDLIILGHVLPARDNYRPTCYHGYARTVTQVVPPPSLSASSSATPPEVRAQLFGHSNVDLWAFVGHESKWLSSPPFPELNYTNSVDKRLWWERQVDESSGRFGKLIREVWSVDHSLHQTEVERSWESMEDDPTVLFAEDQHGDIWPTSYPAALSKPTTIPADFVDNVLKEFKRVIVQDTLNPRLGVTTITPSIIPKYFPSYRIFYYLRKPSSLWSHLSSGTLVDYDVYWANIPALNKHPLRDMGRFFKRLYRFSSTYDIPDLSVDSYLVWAEKLVSSKKLRNTFRSLSTLNS
ncbi:Endopolyphosphatase [Coemansia sp. RSA 988]|nr:Endopolyphosphatase [Coemansia sp. RSA 988]